MAGRHALLIGVPQCDDDRFSQIGDVVRNDVDSMRRALEPSGYTVTTFGVDDSGREPTATRIRSKLRTACKDAPRDSVLLLYFSGHGVSFNGRDHLVPSDADSSDPQSLVPVIPEDLADCRARLVVFFVDACRDDPAKAEEPGPPGGHIPYPTGGSFVLVNGCEPGQRCHYTETGSFFTQALAQILDRRHPAQRLSEVIKEVSLETRRRAVRNEGLSQSPGIPHEAMLHSAENVPICDGDELTGAWQRAATTTPVWTYCGEEPAHLDAAREAVQSLVEKCGRLCGEAYDALRVRTGIQDDPWFDQNYPVRVLERMTSLLGEVTDLRPAEAAILIAAPFLREVVLAEGIRLAAGIAPTNFTRTYQQGPRTDLEITHEMHQQIVRRADGLGRRSLTKERDALAMWLVHQWLAARQSIWRSPAAEDCFQRGAVLLKGTTTGLSDRETPTLVESLLRAVGARPADSLVVERLSGAHVSDRWRALACVLWLSGITAADLRRMPPVIADHIGTRMELPLSTVKSAADRLAWIRREDGTLDLQMPCDHPAQYAAFEDMVAGASRARATIAGLAFNDQIAAALPTRFTGEGLRSERRAGAPAFEVPLSRFRLAEDKVRELLMGRQLYDDPALAIRELYQNALDACRYRDTRLEGLRRSNRVPAAWAGLVSFRQGVEGDREYIECEDNGVGMDTGTLKQVFANAGERFVYRESFRAEQAVWQELDPPLQLFSNSQFGVGVFSYFMLADEITLVTRPVGQNGIVSDQAYRVDIASSGSLFQITPADELPAGGTRVRLYLTGDDEHLSVLATLRKLLWISDFRVEVTDRDSDTEVWEPRELRYQDETAVSLKYRNDLWWVSGEGGLAADGIRTNEKIFGLIVNLRDARRPQFTVDRKKLRKWDRDWVREQISASLPELTKWPGLTLSWLWQVTDSNPEIAQQIFRFLTETRSLVSVGTEWAQGVYIDLQDMGCLPYDRELFGPDSLTSLHSRWFTSWRAGQWTRLAKSQPNTKLTSLISNNQGFPNVEPIDGKLLHLLDTFYSDGLLSVDEMLLAAIKVNRSTDYPLRRLRRHAITGLNISNIRECPPFRRVIEKEEEFPLARAIAAWSRPGSNSRTSVAGWLIKASAELDLPVGQILDRAATLVHEDWVAPDIDLGELSNRTCTNADAKVVSANFNGIPPWADSPLSPAHIIASSNALGRDIAQILALCDSFAPLGIRVAGRERYPADLTTIEVEALKHAHSAGEIFTPFHIVLIAAKTGISVAEARDRLSRVHECQLLTLPRLTGPGDYTPDFNDIDFIDNTMISYARSTRSRLFTRENPYIILTRVMRAHRPSQRTVTRARKMAPFASSGAPVTWPEIIDLASDMRCSIQEAHSAVLEIFPEARMPTMAPIHGVLEPHFDMNEVLLTPWATSRESPTWSIDPGDIVRGALHYGRSLGDFLSMIEPYRALGCPLPEPATTQRAELDHFTPDEYDHDMLLVHDDHGIDSYISDINALTLIRISGRLGWHPAEADRRLSRLTPIGVKNLYPTEHIPDEIVRWQDLLLLTEFFDGHAPAIAGRVTREHVRRAAEETQEAESWIVDRLKLYAPLFELDLGDLDG